MRLKFLEKKLREPDHTKDEYEEWESNRVFLKEELEKNKLAEFKHFLHRWTKELNNDNILDIAVTCMFSDLEKDSQVTIAKRWNERLFENITNKQKEKYEEKIKKLQKEVIKHKNQFFVKEKWINYIEDLCKKDAEIKKLFEDNPLSLETLTLPADNDFMFVGTDNFPNLIRWKNIEIEPPSVGKGHIELTIAKYKHLGLNKSQIKQIKKRQIASGQIQDFTTQINQTKLTETVTKLLEENELLKKLKTVLPDTYVADLLEQINELKSRNAAILRNKNKLLDECKKIKSEKQLTK